MNESYERRINEEQEQIDLLESKLLSPKCEKWYLRISIVILTISFIYVAYSKSVTSGIILMISIVIFVLFIIPLYFDANRKNEISRHKRTKYLYERKLDE